MQSMRGPARPGRRATVGALLAAPLAGLAGCAPEHDWREVRVDEAGFAVMLPAKPARMSRSIHLEAMKLEMTMVGAQAREVSYTVGSVALPDAKPQTLARALAAMRLAMVRNIGGTERAARPVQVARTDAGGAPAGAVEGVEVEAGGRMREREATLIARFVGVPGFALQAVVLGPAPDREQAQVFLESLKLRR
jgi:hypothetical protein